jgi:hypothetical protein
VRGTSSSAAVCHKRIAVGQLGNGERLPRESYFVCVAGALSQPLIFSEFFLSNAQVSLPRGWRKSSVGNHSLLR